MFLGLNHARLNYAKVWNSGFPRALVLGVWCCSLYFPRKMAQRVQQKVERFLATSPLLNPKSYVIRVPTHCMHTLALVKHHLSGLISMIYKSSQFSYV